MKSIFRNSAWLIAVFLLGAPAHAQPDDLLSAHRLGRSDSTRIRVIYPKPGQTIGAVDSTFILGHLPKTLPVDPDDLVLVVNDSSEFPIHKDGGFLAWIPIASGNFVFRLRAFPKDLDTQLRVAEMAVAAGSLSVVVPRPKTSGRSDSLVILGEYERPAGDLVLTAGDQLRLNFQATPSMTAWATVPGVSDSVPMVETPPRAQAYWGESVFGAGAIPDSLLIRGIYTGSITVPESASVQDTIITYHIAIPQTVRDIIATLLGYDPDTLPDTARFFNLALRDSAISSYRVSLNHPEYPFTVRFLDSVQTIRHGPRRGYFSIFQPEGVEAEVVGAEGDWYRLRLSHSQHAWAARQSVQPLPRGTVPPNSLLRVIRTYSQPEHTRIEFPLSGKHAYQIFEDDRRTIRVRLFGVTSDTDWIRYDFQDSLVDFAAWNQPEPGLYELTIHTPNDIWGYDGFYEGNRFYLQLNRPPHKVGSIKGKRIVIDPGHSADPGSVGATGMTEAEANLGIAKMLQHVLERRGAEVIMTREDTSHVPLYDRPSIAKAVDADLFVSVHNNALPDGVNPFTNNGTSSFYYHPHSMPLAKAIHRRMIAATGLPDHGLYYGNLAVQRPTQYPAVLIECAFMIIPEQEALLKTKRYRIDVARAIANGIEDFLEGYDDGQ